MTHIERFLRWHLVDVLKNKSEYKCRICGETLFYRGDKAAILLSTSESDINAWASLDTLFAAILLSTSESSLYGHQEWLNEIESCHTT